MKAVAMLVNEFPPLPVGGAERQAERLAQYLARHNWRVWVITRHAPGLARQEERDGYQILRPRAIGYGKVRSLMYVLGAVIALFRLRHEYEVVHAHLAFSPAFAAVLTSRIANKPVLIKLGNSGEFGDIQVSHRSIRGRLRLAVLRHWASAIIVLDEAMRNEALAAGFTQQNIYLINNGIDAQAFTPRKLHSQSKANLGLEGKIVGLFCGRLVKQKDLPTLLDGLHLALPDCPTLHLLLVGDGPERKALEEQALRLNIQEQITFLGNQADVRPYLEIADFFALPSLSEGISNSLLEAMSCGLACLATSVGGNNQVLEDGKCGVLLPMNHPQAWAQALVELGNQPHRREQLGQAARQRILRQYDFSITGSQYEALYAHLSAGRTERG